tara:strand:+ start:3603 stop:5213 length:1611 start_codon:yes stop_codon:yes gene_type:complete
MLKHAVFCISNLGITGELMHLPYIFKHFIFSNLMVGPISRKVVTESIWKLFSTITGQVGALIFVVIISRILKPEGFGVYNLVLAIVLIFITFADAGINRAVLRYVSASLGKNDKKKASSYVKYLLKLKFSLLIVLAIILIAIAYPLSFFVFNKPELFLPLIIISFYLIAISLESFFAQLFYALKKLKYLAIKQIIFQILRISLVLLVFALLMGKNLLIEILMIVVLSNFVALFVLLFFLRKHASFLFQRTDKKIDKKRVFRFIKYFAVAGISSPIFGYIDTLMLGAFLPIAFVGYYSASFGLIMAISGFILVSAVLLPVFTQLKDSQLKEAFDKVFRYVGIITIPLLFGALALGKYLIRLIYGHEYLSGALPFSFLTLLIFSTLLSGVIVSLFSAREKPEYFVKILLFSSVLNIVLNYIFIKGFMNISLIWAMTGAGIATITSRYFYLFSLGRTASKNLGIRFKPVFVIKPLVASVLMFLTLFYINRFVEDITLLIGLGEVILGAGIYLVVMFLIGGLNNEDVEMIKSVIKREKSD